MQYLDKVLDILDYMSIKFNVASKEPIYFIKKLAEKVHIGYSLLIDKIGYSGRVFSFREGKVLNWNNASLDKSTANFYFYFNSQTWCGSVKIFEVWFSDNSFVLGKIFWQNSNHKKFTRR